MKDKSNFLKVLSEVEDLGYRLPFKEMISFISYKITQTKSVEKDGEDLFKAVTCPEFDQDAINTLMVIDPARVIPLYAEYAKEFSIYWDYLSDHVFNGKKRSEIDFSFTKEFKLFDPLEFHKEEIRRINESLSKPSFDCTKDTIEMRGVFKENLRDIFHEPFVKYLEGLNNDTKTEELV